MTWVTGSFVLRASTALAVAACLVALAAHDGAASGISMKWNDCRSAGWSAETFACDTDVGSHALVGSFIPPAGITQLIGQEIVVDLCAMTPFLPSWWQMGSGECRGTSFTATSEPTTTSCLPYWNTRTTYDLASYRSVFSEWNNARILMESAVPQDQAGAVSPTAEYYSFRFQFDNARTTGADACAGCDQGVCIIFNSLRLVQPASSVLLTNSVNDMFTTWQGGVIGCPFIVPTRRTSWGAIKSLYR